MDSSFLLPRLLIVFGAAIVSTLLAPTFLILAACALRRLCRWLRIGFKRCFSPTQWRWFICIFIALVGLIGSCVLITDRKAQDQVERRQQIVEAADTAAEFGRQIDPNRIFAHTRPMDPLIVAFPLLAAILVGWGVRGIRWVLAAWFACLAVLYAIPASLILLAVVDKSLGGVPIIAGNEGAVDIALLLITAGIPWSSFSYISYSLSFNLYSSLGLVAFPICALMLVFLSRFCLFFAPVSAKPSASPQSDPIPQQPDRL